MIPAALKVESPEAANVRPDHLARVVDLLHAGVADGAMPGGTVCAFRNGRCFLHEAFGTLDGARPVTTDTRYDLASITKPVATASSIVTLVEQGRLLLGASLGDLLGEIVPEHLKPLTVLRLLTHTSSIKAWTPCYDAGLGLDSAVTAIFALPAPDAAPGTRYEYSCLNFILLAKIIEVVTGKTVAVFAREHVFDPLGLESLTFRPGVALQDRIAPTVSQEGPGKGEPLVGVVHDGNARGIEAGSGSVSGNAGLFGTAADVAAFGEAVRTGRLFGAPATARCLESQIRPEVGGHTLLFFAQPNGLTPVGDLISDRAVGHSGFTGTSLVIDPATNLTVAVLTNSVYTDGKGKWLPLRRRFMNALSAALA